LSALESFITWAVKRSKNGGKEETLLVELASEPSRMIRESYENSKHTDEIISLRDHDGVPMVYTPRSALENQLKMAEALRDLSKDSSNRDEEISKKIDEILSNIKKP
jgi:hypothetical protein